MQFNTSDVHALLKELSNRIGTEGLNGNIYLVGGAAISFLNKDRHATSDIDALLHPAQPILEIAKQMAIEKDLPVDWLNDAVKAFVPFNADDFWEELQTFSNLTIWIAKPQLLLAMKLRANRGKRDTSDIEYLLDYLNIASVEQAQVIYKSFYSQEVISDSAAQRIESWLEKRRN
jgi:hypothetical protein